MPKKRKKIGIALSGGGAKGSVHIGVLKALKKANIPIDFIAGTSVGAIIGAAYASGLEPEEIEKAVLNLDWNYLFSFTVPRYGIITTDNMRRVMQNLTKNQTFNQTKIPLRVIAADITKGRRVVFKDGSIAEAVMASISIPGLFPPVQHKGHELVDGGIVDPVPVNEVREMGADVVIAVDLSYRAKGSYVKIKSDNTFIDKARKDFMRAQVLAFRDLITVKLVKLPKFIFKVLVWIIDKLLNPDKFISISQNFLRGKGSPAFLSSTINSFNLMTNELSSAQLKISKPDVIIKPGFVGIEFFGFENIQKGIKEGEIATAKSMRKIKQLAKPKTF